LEAKNLFYIARRTVQQQEFLYFSARVDSTAFLLEVSVSQTGCRCCCKTQNSAMVQSFENAIVAILSS